MHYALFQTFRPKKRFTQGTIRYSLHKQAQASLQSGINLRQVVKLPEGENMNDWTAVHGRQNFEIKNNGTSTIIQILVLIIQS